jgi:hypothetical protein
MVVQTIDPYMYRFDSITWVYDFDQSFAVNPVTKVSFQFVNFTRRESLTPAVFYKPFLVGVYEGSCTELDELPTNTIPSYVDSSVCADGPMLAISQCGGTVITVHQCGINLIVSETTITDSEPGWDTVRRLDMTELVQ